jgi:hypothetical protein
VQFRSTNPNTTANKLYPLWEHHLATLSTPFRLTTFFFICATSASLSDNSRVGYVTDRRQGSKPKGEHLERRKPETETYSDIDTAEAEPPKPTRCHLKIKYRAGFQNGVACAYHAAGSQLAFPDHTASRHSVTRDKSRTLNRLSKDSIRPEAIQSEPDPTGENRLRPEVAARPFLLPLCRPIQTARIQVHTEAMMRTTRCVTGSGCKSPPV